MGGRGAELNPEMEERLATTAETKLMRKIKAVTNLLLRNNGYE